jgi:hypothetical protein
MSPKVKTPPMPPPAPPPVSVSGPEKAKADLEARRKMAKAYNFSDTILSPTGLKTTLG